MKPIEFPKFVRLRGEKAIKALYDFISELEEQRDVELTDKQATALIKIAKELILSIEAEMQSSALTKRKSFRRCTRQLEPNQSPYYVHSPLHDAMGLA